MVDGWLGSERAGVAGARQIWWIARLGLSPRVMMQLKLPKPQRFVFIRFFPALGFAAAPWRTAASACLAHCASSSASS